MNFGCRGERGEVFVLLVPRGCGAHQVPEEPDPLKLSDDEEDEESDDEDESEDEDESYDEDESHDDDESEEEEESEEDEES